VSGELEEVGWSDDMDKRLIASAASPRGSTNQISKPWARRFRDHVDQLDGSTH
jgi:hypothetical protein